MSDSDWQSLASRLHPAHLQVAESPKVGQAAVLLGLTDTPANPSLILTLRARHLVNHPSEVAFPGGKWERSDKNLVHTALRESFEEVGLAPDCVRVLGRYPERFTKNGVSVTPIVGVVPGGLALVPDPAELEEVFLMPLRLLRKEAVVRFDHFKRGKNKIQLPVFHYEGFVIWGLTAALALQLAEDYWAGA